ncbi:NAD(P)H-binding protein [Serratia ureilytica]|nr:NAD(P)H-binding protein [Serratia ureilytica]
MSGTVAVTGATGFIGRHIVRELLAQGFSVRALTRQADKAAADNLQWIPGALEDRPSLTMIPILNLVILPVAVCGATAMWVDRYRSQFVR